MHDEPTLAYVSDGAFISTLADPCPGPDSLGSMSSPRRQMVPEKEFRDSIIMVWLSTDSYSLTASEDEAKASLELYC